MTQKELLTRIDERVTELQRQLDNHLKSHLWYSIMAWTTAIGAITGIIVLLLQ